MPLNQTTFLDSPGHGIHGLDRLDQRLFAPNSASPAALITPARREERSGSSLFHSSMPAAACGVVVALFAVVLACPVLFAQSDTNAPAQSMSPEMEAKAREALRVRVAEMEQAQASQA